MTNPSASTSSGAGAGAGRPGRRGHTAARPVVSVGNLAMGGRGKTPVVALVARLLLEAGERPAILSRGYKRRQRDEDVTIVSDGTDLRADLDRSGDEPLMLARAIRGAAVLVHPVRARAAAVAEETLGATVHVLDDGFQHRSLARDVDIVLVTPTDLAGRRLPFGRLRSPVASLARAHAVIVDAASAALVRPQLASVIDPERTALFTLVRRIGPPDWLEPHDEAPSAEDPVVALAGIAAPSRFVGSLTEAGWRVAETLAFADHHRYTPRDLDRLAEAVARTRASAVLTTEKDAIRLRPLRPLPVPVAVVPLLASVEPAPEFRTWLLARLREARS